MYDYHFTSVIDPREILGHTSLLYPLSKIFSLCAEIEHPPVSDLFILQFYLHVRNYKPPLTKSDPPLFFRTNVRLSCFLLHFADLNTRTLRVKK